MSGIAGIKSSKPFTITPLLGKMADALSFSSMSKSETWSDTQAGLCRVHVGMDNPEQQPIFNNNRTKCIVMFGECFDYEEQKQELVRLGHVFNHQSNDAEFCLNLYEEYGDSAFAMLNGSFCLAINDLNTGELLLVSDRLGTRPLFYGLTFDSKIIFATQVSPVLCLPEIPRKLDVNAAMEFCVLQRVLGEKTFHEAIKILPPASVLRYRTGHKVITPYWHLNYNPLQASVNDYAEELASILHRSARNLHRGHARVAMLLSGGLDARMVVAAAEDKITCYSFGDYSNSEVETARNIAKVKGFEFHFLPRDPDQYVTMLDTAVELGNGMHAFNHAHALGFLDTISQQCDVVTHGFAPELLFRGTNLPKIKHNFWGFYGGKKLDLTLNKTNLVERLLERNYNLVKNGILDLLTVEGRRILEQTIRYSSQEIIEQASKHSRNIYDQFLWPDVYYHSRYPSMLFESSLRAFMTERSMFFCNGLIDLHLKMPLEFRSDNRVWINALKRLNTNIAKTVDANTGYSPETPVLLISMLKSARTLSGSLPLLWRFAGNKNKQNINPSHSPKSWPRFDWMICNNLKMKQAVANTINDPEALPSVLFNHQHIKDLLSDHLEGRGHHRDILFALLTFGRWHKKYMAS